MSWEGNRKRWRKTCEPSPLIFPGLCSLPRCRRAQTYLTFLMSRTSGAHPRAPHGSASPWGTGSQDLRWIPRPRPYQRNRCPTTPVQKAVPGGFPGSSQSSGRRGRTKIRLGAQVRAILHLLRATKSDTAKGITRGIHGDKTGAREQVRLRLFIARGAQLQLSWRLKLL